MRDVHPFRVPLATGLALSLALAVSACGSGSAGAPASSAPTAPSATAAGDALDVCALVPAKQLAAAMGADPGSGTPAKGRIDGGQCTWTVSDTHTAIAQYTRKPDAYLPEGAHLRPKSAADVPGASRGFAAAETHTILIVKGGKGLLFSDIALEDADQAAYDDLAAAIAAKM